MKTIKNRIIKSEVVPWKDLIFLQEPSLKRLNEKDREELRNSILNNDIVQTFMIWENEGNKYCLDGFHRCKMFRELESEGYILQEEYTCNFVDCSDIKEAAKLVLIYSSVYAKVQNKGLSHFIINYELDLESVKEEINIPGVSIGQLELSFLDKKKRESSKVKSENLSSLEVEEIVHNIINEQDTFIFQLSGGRDSTLALLKALPLIPEGKKKYGIHVDTGAEFPDLLSYIIDICQEVNLELIILHPKRNIIQYYKDKGSFPDSLFRDCQKTFINDVIDNFNIDLQKEGRKVVTIRGGRAKQKTTLSKSNVYQEVKKNKYTIKILNPLFYLPEGEYEKEIKNINIWKGYKLGFDRTACWFCPFQRTTQWEALKKYYPLLFEQMKILAKTLTYRQYDKDPTFPKFYEYFLKEEITK